jgi:hypothetical protein
VRHDDDDDYDDNDDDLLLQNILYELSVLAFRGLSPACRIHPSP